MTAAADVLEVARGQVGTTEYPPGSNRTRYGRWYGVDGVPWCLTFCQWVFAHAGMPLPVRTLYTPTMAAFYKATRTWSHDPLPGDLAFFDFPDAKARIQHVGIVVGATATSVTCIEGNTSPGTSGSQDNGGGVYVRTRTLAHAAGFGRPHYSISAAAPPRRPPDMLLAKPTDSPAVYLFFGRADFVGIEDPADLTAIKASGVPYIEVSPDTFRRMAS